MGQSMPADYPWQSLETLIYEKSSRWELSSDARQELLDGNESPILEVLVPLLPRLEILEVNVGSCGIAWLNHALDLCYGPSTPEIQHIRIFDTEGRIDHAEALQDFIQSHSRKSVTLDNLSMDTAEPWIMRYDHWPNHISSLSLLNCRVGSTTIHALLASLENNRSFSCITDDNVDNYLVVEPYFIVAGLVTGSKASLEELTILGCYHDTTSSSDRFYQLGSLRCFENLKYLTVQAEILMGNGHRPFEGAQSLLPCSIRKLGLNVEADEHGYQKIFSDSHLASEVGIIQFDELKELKSFKLHGVPKSAMEFYMTRYSWQKLIDDGINIDWH